ncbi:hypothetical protein AC578_106 [Pseudocercospora eumusae]|uniref:2EXR domain-containing protein n=1 Tax=Pseudocercospora eumusae TaxID=321146 RepID=A0A139HNX9_9PEZI|nr:hypothetical protein AC578_106 [Pseudocercospora eumusae]
MADIKSAKSGPNSQVCHTRELHRPEFYGHSDLAVLLACEQGLIGARSTCKARNLHNIHPKGWTPCGHGSLRDYGFSNLGVLLGCEQGLPESRTACELFGLHNKHPPDDICSRFILTKPIASKFKILATKNKRGSRSHFLKLPLELRKMIYEYVIPESWNSHPRNQGYFLPWSNMCENTSQDLEKCLRLHGLRIQRYHLEPALLRTSKLIRKEAMEVFEKFLVKAEQDPVPSSGPPGQPLASTFAFWTPYMRSLIKQMYLETRRQMRSLSY